MRDRRVPGNGEKPLVTFVCPVPGCRESALDTDPPRCSKHGVRMRQA